MIVISLEEKADEILQFFEKYDIYCLYNGVKTLALRRNL